MYYSIRRTDHDDDIRESLLLGLPGRVWRSGDQHWGPDCCWTTLPVTSLLPGCVAYQHLQVSVLHSHWSRNAEARLSLVERIIVLLRQLSYAIKNQLLGALARKDPTGLAPRWFFMAEESRAVVSNSSDLILDIEWRTLLQAVSVYRLLRGQFGLQEKEKLVNYYHQRRSGAATQLRDGKPRKIQLFFKDVFFSKYLTLIF